MTQWHLSYDGKQIGPLDISQAIAHARQNPSGYAWREGFTEWQPIASIAEFSSKKSAAPAPPPIKQGVADEIDFTIFGSEMQFVEVELDPGESAVAGRGSCAAPRRRWPRHRPRSRAGCGGGTRRSTAAGGVGGGGDGRGRQSDLERRFRPLAGRVRVWRRAGCGLRHRQ